MQIVSYNVNGIRAAIRKGFLDWLAAGDYDIVCLQEIKATEDQVDLEPLRALGYDYVWHAAEKKGYSGVATLWKRSVCRDEYGRPGCGVEAYDLEGRVLRTDFGDLTVLNCYFPSGSRGDHRQAFKMEFLRDFDDYLAALRAERSQVIILGDYNIAHTEQDIHNPVANKKKSGFLPEERDWMSRHLATGLTDAFRHLYPDTISYSWWSYRAGARQRNKGWRIDYQVVTESLRDRIREAQHLRDDQHSDHCALLVHYDYELAR